MPLSLPVLLKSKTSSIARKPQLLRKFNLKPNTPPNDFQGVYVYTLIKYGVGKPKPLLELFRRSEIKEAFNSAFQANNPHILLNAGQNYLRNQELGFDYRRELAEFSALFIEIAKRPRTPVEVMRDHQLEGLQQSLATIRNQLEQLNSLPALEAQIAQFAQNYQALLPATQNPESVLGEQMCGWFNALSYDWENYQVFGQDYFEWIIMVISNKSETLGCTIVTNNFI